jgi:hypothetical protein
MSDNSAFGFGKFVPGFDFLQNLAKSASQPSAAGGSIPGMSNWVAPTLSVEELDKRIQELKAVQFWLEQNGTALKATIQALEVQKMTLTTLQGMNVNMSELAKAFTAHTPETAAPNPVSTPAPEPAAVAEAPETVTPQPKNKSSKPKRDSKASAEKTAVDPMQWWGSLTQQFQNIASAAMQDVAAQAMKTKMDPEAEASASPPTATKISKPVAKKAAHKKPAAKKPRPSRA